MSGLTARMDGWRARMLVALAGGTRYLVWYYLLSTLCLALPATAQAPWTGPGVGLPAAQAVPVVGLTVSDMDRSLAFYTSALPSTT